MASSLAFARTRSWVLTALLGCTLGFGAFGPNLAQAQERVVIPGPEGDPSDEDIGRARELFVQGTEDASGGRWADALRSFEEAYTLSGIGAALYNAATTLRSLGRYRDARDAFDQLLRDHPELSGEMAESAPQLRQEVAARVAILELRDVPAELNFQLQLNGASREVGPERPIEVETDAGRHSLRLEAPRFEPFLWEGSVRDGERREIGVTLQEIVEPREGVNVRLVVILTVVGVLVVGAAVTAGLLLREEGLNPESQAVWRL
ncbi:MAG: tetratricopeptide repeat protein [Myxococcota bacterium]